MIDCSTGLPPSFGDTYDSASDSEEEFDEADEDSNGKLMSFSIADHSETLAAEEYYKNDYPEDEDDSESSGMCSSFVSLTAINFSVDEFHESSDYDEMMEYHHNREEFDD